MSRPLRNSLPVPALPLLLFAVAGVARAADPDPREIVRRSVDAAQGQNEKLARQYTFLERVEAQQFDARGNVKSSSLKTYDVTVLEGSPYRRLVERDDRPLSPVEERREQESLRSSIEKRRKETEPERAKRLAEYEKERAKYRKAIREIPDAFQFRLRGEEPVDGRPAYVIDATPLPGYQPKDRYARLFRQLRGSLWIDKADFHWRRADAELIDTFSLGWILVRIARGAHVTIDLTRVNGEVWLPQRIGFSASARIGLFKTMNVRQVMTYRSYKKFQTDSRILSTSNEW